MVYPIVMRSLMLCPIAAVAERFRAAVVLARVRPLSGVRSLVNLQVLQATESFLATSKLKQNSNTQLIFH